MLRPKEKERRERGPLREMTRTDGYLIPIVDHGEGIQERKTTLSRALQAVLCRFPRHWIRIKDDTKQLRDTISIRHLVLSQYAP